ncbi:MAG: shikimate dehydrogenase, partial [Rhodoluna sp.]
VVMAEAAYQAHGLHYRYINCEVEPESLGQAVEGARAMNWKGFHCSIPHKTEVIKFLDELGESARVIGAVNCVVNRDGKLVGENTDGKGFVKAFEEVRSAAGETVVLLGAGGAARAIAVELALAGAKKIYILNRTVERGQILTDLLNENTPATAEFIEWNKTFVIPKDATAVINSTSIGMAGIGDLQDIDYDSINDTMLVADVIINPPSTPFLEEAAKRGAHTLNGHGMVVYQAVVGIKYWTGADVDPEILRAQLVAVL